jgi:hypothetical protein
MKLRIPVEFTLTPKPLRELFLKKWGFSEVVKVSKARFDRLILDTIESSASRCTVEEMTQIEVGIC